MTVEELIKELLEYDEDQDVRIPSPTGGDYSPCSVELTEYNEVLLS